MRHLARNALQLFDGRRPALAKCATQTVAAQQTATLVVAVADRRLRVLALALLENYPLSPAVTSAKLTDGVADLSGVITAVKAVLPFNPMGWFEGGLGCALVAINSSATIPVTVAVTYMEAA